MHQHSYHLHKSFIIQLMAAVFFICAAFFALSSEIGYINDSFIIEGITIICTIFSSILIVVGVIMEYMGPTRKINIRKFFDYIFIAFMALDVLSLIIWMTAPDESSWGIIGMLVFLGLTLFIGFLSIIFLITNKLNRPHQLAVTKTSVLGRKSHAVMKVFSWAIILTVTFFVLVFIHAFWE